MAVLAARSNVPVRNKKEGSALSAVADTFYQGAVAYHVSGASGHLSPIPAAGASIAGIVTETITATIGDEVPLMVEGEFGVPNTNFNHFVVGSPAWCDVGAASDNVADIIASGIGTIQTNDFTIGRIVAYNVDGKTWIRLGTETEPSRAS